jgi:hypothetical protein
MGVSEELTASVFKVGEAEAKQASPRCLAYISKL